MKNQNYKFVFVTNNMGYSQEYSLLETNISLSNLTAIENSQNLTRSQSNTDILFCDKANNFFYNQKDKYMKILISRQKEFIEGYPIYEGYFGNY